MSGIATSSATTTASGAYVRKRGEQRVSDIQSNLYGKLDPIYGMGYDLLGLSKGEQRYLSPILKPKLGGPFGGPFEAFGRSKNFVGDVFKGKNILTSADEAIFGKKQGTPWEEAGMSWAEWNEKTRPTLGTLGITAADWEHFQKASGEAVGTPGVSRGEENPLLIQNFWKWKEKMAGEEERRKRYLQYAEESPGRAQTVLAGNNTLLG